MSSRRKRGHHVSSRSRRRASPRHVIQFGISLRPLARCRPGSGGSPSCDRAMLATYCCNSLTAKRGLACALAGIASDAILPPFSTSSASGNSSIQSDLVFAIEILRRGHEHQADCRRARLRSHSGVPNSSVSFSSIVRGRRYNVSSPSRLGLVHVADRLVIELPDLGQCAASTGSPLFDREKNGTIRCVDRNDELAGVDFGFQIALLRSRAARFASCI